VRHVRGRRLVEGGRLGALTADRAEDGRRRLREVDVTWRRLADDAVREHWTRSPLGHGNVPCGAISA